MFPYLRFGPWLIQMPLLALLIGLWGGISLVEQEAKRLKLNPSVIGNLVMYTIVVCILGARLGYAVRFRDLYTSQPMSLLALTPTTLSPSAGFVIGLVTFVILLQHRSLPVRPTLDALAPGLTFFPSQFYETFLALAISFVIHKRFPKPEGTGINFLLAVSLTAASRVFLEAFRGDSVIWLGGFREAQVLALVLMAVCFYWMRRWMELDALPT